MTDQPKEMGPKQLAWLKRRIPAFREARAKVGSVVEAGRASVEKAMVDAAEREADAAV